jgi:Tol biopolymer transport system component
MKVTRKSRSLWFVSVSTFGVATLFLTGCKAGSTSVVIPTPLPSPTITTPAPSPSATNVPSSPTVLPSITPFPLACGLGILAYDDGLSLVLKNTASEELKRIDGIEFEGTEPLSWSPNGRYIAYTHYPVTNTAPLMVVNVETGKIQQLTEGSAFDFDWSPDSSHLAFMMIGNSLFPGLPDDGLYSINVDSTELTLLVKRFDGRRGVETGGARWSPVGDRLAYVYSESIYPHTVITPQVGINLLSLESRESQTILTLPSAGELTWSPNGQRIAFIGSLTGVPLDDPRFGNDVYVVHADGSGLQKLTEQKGYYLSLSWSPDGQWLMYAYSSVSLGQMHIYLTRSDGSETRQLSASPLQIPQPKWSPDGKCIAYKDSGLKALIVMNADGTQRKALTNGYVPFWFGWKP